MDVSERQHLLRVTMARWPSCLRPQVCACPAQGDEHAGFLPGCKISKVKHASMRSGQSTLDNQISTESDTTSDVREPHAGSLHKARLETSFELRAIQVLTNEDHLAHFL